MSVLLCLCLPDEHPVSQPACMYCCGRLGLGRSTVTVTDPPYDLYDLYRTYVPSFVWNIRWSKIVPPPPHALFHITSLICQLSTSLGTGDFDLGLGTLEEVHTVHSPRSTGSALPSPPGSGLKSPSQPRVTRVTAGEKKREREREGEISIFLRLRAPRHCFSLLIHKLETRTLIQRQHACLSNLRRMLA